MLYSREQLRDFTLDEDKVAAVRYIHRVLKNETRKILPHECDYLALKFRNLFREDENGNPVLAFDPYEQDFLSDAVFKFLIVVYFENLDFLMPVYQGPKELTADEVARDFNKFNELLSEWQLKLENKKNDPLLHEVKLEYLRKLQIVNRQYKNGAFGYYRYKRRLLEQELLAFYIYFTVKIFFKDVGSSFVESTIYNQRFVMNFYGYVHVVSRHYIPKFNGIDPERSFNTSLPFIDPFFLPNSVLALLQNYFDHAPIDYVLNEEYMIFQYRNEYYMIWWKHKHITEINHQLGYEIRTLYRMESQRDFEKIPGKTVVAIDPELSFYY